MKKAEKQKLFKKIAIASLAVRVKAAIALTFNYKKMIQLIKMIALVLGIGPSHTVTHTHHYHPTTYHVNGKEVSEKEFKNIRTSISSLTTKEFVEYYYKSKNIICL